MTTSIIIPCRNHGAYLPAAIDSALAQTAPVEVIVVDDGSTDDTQAVIASYGDRIRSLTLLHGGPSIARNAGIEAATGEMLRFLDADDTIEPTATELQLAWLDADAGWVFGDIRIQDVHGKVELASDRYRYKDRHLDGWIAAQFAGGNFIPIHAPLVRRSVLADDIRFDLAKQPEDWHFWWAVAERARARYCPAIVGTYIKRRRGRNTSRERGVQTFPGVTLPLRLNLGCGRPGALSWHPMPGFVNLDKALGWRFEDGLGMFESESVSGVTISHTMMYVRDADWTPFLADVYRVLRPGGVVRLTEDDATSPKSSRYGGWKGSEPAVTLTDALMARGHLERAGFTVYDVKHGDTHYTDPSLMQAQHGTPPDVFFIEGVRSCNLLLTPHADDEVLFAAFTMLRHRPRVAICFPSGRDYGDTEVRLAESQAAAAILGAGPVEQWGGQDLEAKMREIDARVKPAQVFAPDITASHPEHRAVAAAAAKVFANRVRWFHTYDERGKVRMGDPVAFQQEWLAKKREALACFATQLAHPRARKFFEEDLTEYVP